ncbi:MAG: hypothetical protein ACKPEA_14550 [Planctomycetota bacterium]
MKRVDGTTVSGTVSGFDADGCEGAFGRVDWADMPAAEVNRALRRVLDLGKADQMVLLGRALMSAEDGETMGDSMLRQAVKRDASVQEAADAARAQGVELRRMAAERRVRSALPQAREGSGVQAWPVATDEQRAAALAETKAEAEKALREVNARWTPVESEYWVVYADLTRGDAQELGQRMDNMYRRVAEMFALPKGLNLFHGKGVCIVSADENRFRAIEQAAFGMMPPPGCVGLCHMIGPRVLVNAWRSPDDDMFIATLVHEATHGIMHRYGTPVRLPMWAEEGYAEYVAANSFASSPVDRGRRDWGLKFIRDGNATAPYFEGDSAWPGPNAIGYSIGYMTVDLMIRKKDHLFGEWVKDVKTGVPWEQALKARFGMNAAELAAAVESFYRESERAE